MHCVRFDHPGGPEVLKYQSAPDPQPGPSEARVQVHAIGVNFIDVYHRTGRYPYPRPGLLGGEGSGTIDALGPDATGWQIGDRVAWATHSGSYADTVCVPVAKLLRLPDALDLDLAAAVALQGMTAHFLSHTTFPLQSGQLALVHAGAGGVGLLLTQFARARGARVFTTVSTEDKARMSREAGANDVIVYTHVDFEQEVRRLTAGEGIDVVYDSVGKTTFLKSLNCLRPRGMLVLFGASSGQPDPLEPALLAQRGSLFLTRPTLYDYVADRGTLEQRASDVFSAVARKDLSVLIGHRYALQDAANAHRDLESRKTMGKLLLKP